MSEPRNEAAAATRTSRTRLPAEPGRIAYADMKSSALVLGMILSSVLMAAVDNRDLQEINSLISEGKYEEALQKHLWFHEESKTSTGMGGVRLSFALAQWVELGKKYPKALDALMQIRDQHETALLNGTARFPEFHEVYAINRTLEEDQKTYALFMQLHARQPEIARQCFHVAMDLVVNNKNYEVTASYLGDPIQRYERLEQMREMNLGLMQRNPNLDNPRFKQRADETFVAKTVQLIDILSHLKRMDEAREIQKRALSYFPSPELKSALPP